MNRTDPIPIMRRGSNIIIVGDGTAKVELTQGVYAVIDEADAPLVAPYTWHAVKHSKSLFYARANIPPRRSIRMHRLLFGDIPDDVQVDHIDRDGLNNRRSNLRLANGTIQKLNQSVRTDCTSGCPGVHKRPNGTWQARIAVNNKRVSLGHFKTFEDAQRCMESVREIVDELLSMIPTTAPSNIDNRESA